MMTLKDIWEHPNQLAAEYSAFKVTDRILLTGHSHQAWPDVALAGQRKAGLDAAAYVDEKWGRAFDKARAVQNGFAKLMQDDSGHYALAASTHDLIIRYLSALPLKKGSRIVTTDGEFHTIRRQLDRLAEAGVEIIKVPVEPQDSLPERILAEINSATITVMVSAVFYQTAQIFKGLAELAWGCAEKEMNLMIDVYHLLNVMPFAIDRPEFERAFVVGGGYKYCQLGEGNCFLRFPKDCRLRPLVTGWFSEFAELSQPPKPGMVQYGSGAALFAGATYDPVSHYRAAAVFKFFETMGLSTAFLHQVYQHQVGLLAEKFRELDLDPAVIRLRNNFNLKGNAGFLVLKTAFAAKINAALRQKNIFTDFRGENLRLGPAPYLSDQQLESAIQELGKIVQEGKFDF